MSLIQSQRRRSKTQLLTTRNTEFVFIDKYSKSGYKMNFTNQQRPSSLISYQISGQIQDAAQQDKHSMNGNRSELSSTGTQEMNWNLQSWFICKICCETFNEQKYLKAHLEIHAKPCHCGICGKTFVNERTLTRHLLLHSDERPFSCSLCDFSATVPTLM